MRDRKIPQRRIATPDENSPDQPDTMDGREKLVSLSTEVSQLNEQLDGCGNQTLEEGVTLLNWNLQLVREYAHDKALLERRLNETAARYDRVTEELKRLVGRLKDCADNIARGDSNDDLTHHQRPLTEQRGLLRTNITPFVPDEASAQPLPWHSDRASKAVAEALVDLPQKSVSSQRQEYDSEKRIIVSYLGHFTIRTEAGQEVVPPRGKAGTILKYLLIHGRQRLPREMLMEKFWPRHDAASARNNLNVAVYGLRKSFKCLNLRRPCIVYNDGGYQLDSQLPLVLDIDLFKRSLLGARQLEANGDTEAAFEEYRRATEVYGGDFLQDDLYDGWIEDIRREMRDRYASALRFMAAFLANKNAYAELIKLSDQLLAVDPCDETLHRDLMRAYDNSGRRHLALQQYSLCKEKLAAELDVEPEEETTRLFRTIRSGSRRRASENS